jgi:hypothetical protein
MGKSNKVTKHIEKVDTGKNTKIKERISSLFDLYPSWTFHRCDFDHDKWGFNSKREHIPELLLRLKAFEGQSWGTILSDTSGRKTNAKNHAMSFEKITKEAQARAEQLKLNEFDEIYSLTVTGERRLWGVLSKEDGKFHLVWYDEGHGIYPVNKSHT